MNRGEFPEFFSRERLEEVAERARMFYEPETVDLPALDHSIVIEYAETTPPDGTGR